MCRPWYGAVVRLAAVLAYTAGGNAEIIAAKALQPDIEKDYAGYGLP